MASTRQGSARRLAAVSSGLAALMLGAAGWICVRPATGGEDQPQTVTQPATPTVVYSVDFNSMGLVDAVAIGAGGQAKLALEDDPDSGGQVARFEIVRYYDDHGARLLNCGVAFCGIAGTEGNDQTGAMYFEPSTEYEVAAVLRGNFKTIGVGFKSWSGSYDQNNPEEAFWHGMKSVGCSPTFFVPTAEWTTMTARFRTRSDTVQGGVTLQIWCRESGGKIAMAPGDFLQLRSLTISKIPAKPATGLPADLLEEE